MPALAAAFACGEISREHVDVAVAAVNQLPAAVKRLTSDEGVTGLQVLDGLVTEQAKVGQPGTVDQLGKDLLMVLHPGSGHRPGSTSGADGSATPPTNTAPEHAGWPRT